MARAAYRKASQDWGIWIGICLAGLGVQVFIIVWLSKSGRMNTLGLWDIPMVIGPFVVALLIGWRTLARRNHARISRLAERLAARGFLMVPRPTELERTQFAAPMLHLFPTLELRHGSAPIQWVAMQQSQNPALLFEHEYATGSGKFTVVHHHTVLAWPVAHPDLGNASLLTAPWFMMARYPLLRRRAASGTIEVPGFDHRVGDWTMFGNAETGAQFLTGSARKALAQSPLGEEWSVGSAWACCSFNGTLDGDDIELFVTHARAVVAG